MEGAEPDVMYGGNCSVLLLGMVHVYTNGVTVVLTVAKVRQL